MNASRCAFHTWRRLFLIGLLSLLLALSGLAHAQSGGGYDLEWNTIDNGGATLATGGHYTLGGTVGQPDAGVLAGSGGYTLSGGFWPGGIPAPGYHILLPIVLRGL